MLSNQTVWPILANSFVAVRLDWEQGNHHRDEFGFVLGTGDQPVLKPNGELIPPRNGKRVYGRHGEDTTAEVLRRVLADVESDGAIDTLKLDWFFWPRKQSDRRRGGFYPPPVRAIAQFARLPIAEVHGPLPAALRDSEFLKNHVRQFIWRRGREDGDPSVQLSRVRDGLPDELPTDLGAIAGKDLEAESLGKALDDAWRTYMKDRPLTARGYVENEHGGWMRNVAAQMLREDEGVRKHARAGTLVPPGRE